MNSLHHLSCLESHSSSLKVVNGKQKFLIPLCLVLLKFFFRCMDDCCNYYVTNDAVS